MALSCFIKHTITHFIVFHLDKIKQCKCENRVTQRLSFSKCNFLKVVNVNLMGINDTTCMLAHTKIAV